MKGFAILKSKKYVFLFYVFTYTNPSFARKNSFWITRISFGIAMGILIWHFLRKQGFWFLFLLLSIFTFCSCFLWKTLLPVFTWNQWVSLGFSETWRNFLEVPLTLCFSNCIERSTPSCIFSPPVHGWSLLLYSLS